MASTQTGHTAYLFGGYDHIPNAYSREILAVDLTDDSVRVTGAKLPTALGWASAVWTGTYAFVFGGHGPGSGNVHNEIFRFDPAVDELVKMTAAFPRGAAYSTSAIWDPRDRPEAACAGGCAYIFGGGGTTPMTWIYEYNPATDTLRTFPTSLPNPGRAGTAAVFDGRYAYIFGGDKATDIPIDRIVKFDPVAKTAVEIGERLPEPRTHLRAVWSGERAILAGGRGCAEECTSALSFDPATEEITELEKPIPRGAGAFAAVWDDVRSRFVAMGAWETAGRLEGRVFALDFSQDADAGLGRDMAPFHDDFEGAVLDKWSTVWFPDSAYCSVGNMWSLQKDKPITGTQSLHVEGNCDHNTIATTDRHLDPGRDFAFSFKFRTKDSNSRGAFAYLLASESDGSRAGPRLDTSHLLPLVVPGYDVQGKSNVNVLGKSAAWAPAPFNSALFHTVSIDRVGQTITARFDGAKVLTVGTEEVNIGTSERYRIVLMTSGNWGRATSMDFDDVSLRYDAKGMPGGVIPPNPGPRYFLIHGVLNKEAEFNTWTSDQSAGRGVYDTLVDQVGTSRVGVALYDPSHGDADAILARVQRQFADFVVSSRAGPSEVTVVGHSLGGLVARALPAGDDNGAIGRIVTLDAPNGRQTRLADIALSACSNYRAIAHPISYGLTAACDLDTDGWFAFLGHEARRFQELAEQGDAEALGAERVHVDYQYCVEGGRVWVDCGLTGIGGIRPATTMGFAEAHRSFTATEMMPHVAGELCLRGGNAAAYVIRKPPMPDAGREFLLHVRGTRDFAPGILHLINNGGYSGGPLPLGDGFLRDCKEDLRPILTIHATLNGENVVEPGQTVEVAPGDVLQVDALCTSKTGNLDSAAAWILDGPAGESRGSAWKVNHGTGFTTESFELRNAGVQDLQVRCKNEHGTSLTGLAVTVVAPKTTDKSEEDGSAAASTTERDGDPPAAVPGFPAPFVWAVLAGVGAVMRRARQIPPGGT